MYLSKLWKDLGAKLPPPTALASNPQYVMVTQDAIMTLCNLHTPESQDKLHLTQEYGYHD